MTDAERIADRYLTSTELAERWRVSLSTLSAWRVRGVGPAHVKVGPQIILYSTAEVLRLEAAGVRGVPLERLLAAITDAPVPAHTREPLREHLLRALKL